MLVSPCALGVDIRVGCFKAVFYVVAKCFLIEHGVLVLIVNCLTSLLKVYPPCILVRAIENASSSGLLLFFSVLSNISESVLCNSLILLVAFSAVP